jgi:hypothetical protein
VATQIIGKANSTAYARGNATGAGPFFYLVVVSNSGGAANSAVAHLYVMRLAPVSTNLIANSDKNNGRDWSLIINAGWGGRETNYRFTV